MTICKFFQQGTCRFGNRCRFEHVFSNDVDTYSESTGTSVLNRNKSAVQPTGSSFFSQATPTQFSGSFFNQTTPESRPGGFFNQSTVAPAPEVNRDVVQMVITELMLSEKGGQWPLSCFAPFKERGCFPGLEDHSPEELRFLAYDAASKNNLEECNRKINELYEKNRAVKKQIFSRSPEVVSIIEKLFKAEKIDSFSNSVFTTQQTPVAATNFSFARPVGEGSTKSFFGDGGNVTPAPSVFVTPPRSSGTENAFSAPNNTSPFTRGLESSPSFQQSTTPSFQQSTTPSFFNQPNKPIFGGGNTNQNPGMFGGNTSTWNQSSPAVSEDSLYTAMSELTEEERTIFNSRSFTLGKVPIKPPAKEHCL